jgi:hypothetical protein
MDAHRANNLIGGDADHRKRDNVDCIVVDAVAVVALEDLLLLAEHRAPQRESAVALPS